MNERNKEKEGWGSTPSLARTKDAQGTDACRVSGVVSILEQQPQRVTLLSSNPTEKIGQTTRTPVEGLSLPDADLGLSEDGIRDISLGLSGRC